MPTIDLIIVNNNSERDASFLKLYACASSEDGFRRDGLSLTEEGVQ